MKTTRNFSMYVLLAMFLIYAMLFFIIPKQTFWTADNGLKWIQSESILNQNFYTLEIVNPNPVKDPSMDFILTHDAFTEKINDKTFGQYAAPFLFAEAIFMKVFGRKQGVAIFIFTGTILFLLSWYHLSQVTGLHNRHRVLLMSLFVSTPVFFYGFAFYENIWLCVFFSVFLRTYLRAGVTSGQGVIAGFTLALMVGFRPETIVISGVFMILFYLKHGKIGWMLAGGLPVGLSLAGINFINTGDIMGTMFDTRHQMTVIRQMPFLEKVCMKIDQTGFQFSTNLKTLWLAGVLNVTILMIMEYFRITRKHFLFAVSVFVLLSWHLILVSSGYLNRSFLLNAPILALYYFMDWKNLSRDSRHMFWGICVCFCVLTFGLPIETPSDWGSRYHLVLYLPLSIVIFESLFAGEPKEYQKYMRWRVCVLLVLAGFVIQICGYNRLRETRLFHDERRQFIQASKYPIVTDDFDFICLNAEQYYEKEIFQLPDLDGGGGSEDYNRKFISFLDILKTHDKENIFYFNTSSPTFTDPDLNPGQILIVVPDQPGNEYYLRIIKRWQNWWKDSQMLLLEYLPHSAT